MTSRDESGLSRAFATQKANILALIKKLRLDARKSYRIIEPKIVKPSKAEPMSSEDELVNQAILKRADLKASEHSLTASRQDIQVADAGRLPKIDFALSALDAGRLLTSHSSAGIDLMPSSQQSLASQLGRQIEYTLGFTLTWNLFDRDLTKSNVERARVLAKNKQLDTDDVRNQIVIEVKQAYIEYISAKDQLRANEDGLVAAEKAFQAVKGKYDAGSAKFIDLADAQATLVQAESAQAQSLFQVELQKRVLMTVTGQTN